jgi:hypothetical protein
MYMVPTDRQTNGHLNETPLLPDREFVHHFDRCVGPEQVTRSGGVHVEHAAWRNPGVNVVKTFVFICH